MKFKAIAFLEKPDEIKVNMLLEHFKNEYDIEKIEDITEFTEDEFLALLEKLHVLHYYKAVIVETIDNIEIIEMF